MNTDEIKKVLNEQKPYLKREYGIKSIGVFGSYIREEQKSTSDIDILVDFNKIPGLFKFIELEEYLTSLLDKKVDLVSRGGLKKHIGENILQEVSYI